MNKASRYVGALLALGLTLGGAFSSVAGSDDDDMTGLIDDASEITSEKIYRHKDLASISHEPVGVQLVSIIDSSCSMSDDEFQVQVSALAEALNSMLFRHAIKYKGGYKSVALSVVDFSDNAFVAVPWVDIRGGTIHDKPYKPDPVTGVVDPSVSSYFPDRLDQLTNEIRHYESGPCGGTGIEKGLELAKKLFLASPWGVKEKRVVDLFGDGSAHADLSVEFARDELSDLGVTINGFAILNEEDDLGDYFKDHVVTKTQTVSPDGIVSEKGAVWTLAKDDGFDLGEEASLTAYFNDVMIHMKQKLTVEVAGADTYYKVSGLLGENIPGPVPVPDYH